MGFPFECPVCGHKTNMPQTNADRIRAMSDEELAKWISCGAGMSVGVCGYCKNSELDYCDGIPCGDKTDAEIILEWLKQPAETPTTNADCCVCCGAIIPEGSMVCTNCSPKITEQTIDAINKMGEKAHGGDYGKKTTR